MEFRRVLFRSGDESPNMINTSPAVDVRIRSIADRSQALMGATGQSSRCRAERLNTTRTSPMKLASRLQGRQHPQIWNSAAQLADIPIISTQTLIPAGARAVILAPHPRDDVGACGGLLPLLSNLDHPLLPLSGIGRASGREKLCTSV